MGEAKYVAKQAFTQQIKDEMKLAADTGRDFILRIRDGTQLSKPLQAAMDALKKAGKGDISRQELEPPQSK